jgi:hypothetical protein
MHMWLHVTNQLITSSDKDSNSETNKKLRIHDSWKMQVECVWEANPSVTVLTGRTPDSAVMTTRAGKYH